SLGKPAFISRYNIKNLTIEGIPYLVIGLQIKDFLILCRFLPENTYIDQIGKMGIFIPIVHNIFFKSIRKLAAVIILLDLGKHKILVSLIDILCAATGLSIY